MSIQNRKTILGVHMAMALGALATSDVVQTSGEKIALSTDTKPKPTPKLTGAPFMCSECGRDIKTENGYWHHMINYHGANRSPKSDGEKL